MAHDISAALPASVMVVFQGEDELPVYPVTVTLSSLNLEEAGNAAGFSGTKVFHDVAEHDGTNAGNLTTLTTAVARAYYRWRLARPAQRHVGVVNWEMEAHSDCIEFEHDSEEIATRAVRDEWHEQVEDLLHFPASGGSGSGDDLCDPVYLKENEPRCESGVLRVYERRNKLRIKDNGCLELTQGYWYFKKKEGCCDCSGSGDDPGLPEDPCEPGTCVHCIEPPDNWKLPVSGFTGLCEVFNGNHVLEFIGACVWGKTYQVGLLNVTITLTVTSTTTVTVTFVYSASGINVATTYSGFMQTGKCCNPVSMGLVGSCNCHDREAGPDPPACSSCSGVTPAFWDFTIPAEAATGCFAGLAGTYSLVPTGECFWEQTVGDVTVGFFILGGAPSLIIQDTAGFVTYSVFSSPTPGTLNCCEAIELGLTSADCFDDETTGNVPLTVVLNPSCSSTGPGRCPPIVTAVPECCGGIGGGSGGGGGPGTDFPCCTNCEAMPMQYQLSVAGLTGACAAYNGTFILTHQEDTCIWQDEDELWSFQVSGLGLIALVPSNPFLGLQYCQGCGSFPCLGTMHFDKCSRSVCDAGAPAVLSLVPF